MNCIQSHMPPPSIRHRCLIVGYGSIGARHAKLLSQKGQEVACVTHRTNIPFRVFQKLEEAIEKVHPDLIIVSNATIDHKITWDQLNDLHYNGRVLIEKPLFANLPSNVHMPSFTAFVGYNLRFHPLVKRVKTLLEQRDIFSAQFFVGQYLPSWRPNRDWRKTYSVDVEQGGGVLRDLSHELDLALWFFGNICATAAHIGCWGKLDMNAEDCVDILAETSRCRSLSVHLDYQNLFPHRHFQIQAEGLSLFGNLLSGQLRTQVKEELFVINKNTTYVAQLDALLTEKNQELCSWQEGLEILRFIQLVERASKTRQWETAE